MPLSDTAVRNAKPRTKPFKLSDGGGLHLLVPPHGSKLWRLAYRFGCKQKTLALGIYPAVTLAEARANRSIDCISHRGTPSAQGATSRGIAPARRAPDG